jgi:hypothetical protein
MAKYEVTVPLIGGDGNAFMILGKVTGALKRAGAPQEDIDSYMSEATSGDYDKLLAVTMEWVEVA